MRTVLRAIDEPRATRIPYWEHVMASMTGMEVRLNQMPDARDEIVMGDVGPLTVVECRAGAGVARRTARHIRRDDPDRYLLFVQGEGSAVGEQGGRSAHYRPGDLGLTDLSAPMRCTGTERRATLVSYSKSRSPLSRDEVSRLTGVRMDGGSGTAALISGLVRQLPQHLDADDGANGARIGGAVLDLLHVNLAAHLDRVRTVSVEARTRALLMQCRAYIEEHLHQPDLAPSTVAAAHHMSVRHLHRLFEPFDDGVATLIRRRRLERCRRDLVDPDLLSRPVSAIGARWGLTDASHFSRVFKSVYGLPPAEYRALHGRVDASD